MSAVEVQWYGGDGRSLAAASRLGVVIPVVVPAPGGGASQDEIDELLAMIAALTLRVEALEAGGGGGGVTGGALHFDDSNNSGLIALLARKF